MDPETKFAPALDFTSSDLPTTIEFLERHSVEEIACFTENVVHSSVDKQFMLDIEGQKFTLTEKAYLDFCQNIGIPKAFASKIDSKLLETNVDEMLSFGAKKLRVFVRNKNVICAVKQFSFIRSNPITFLEAGKEIFNNSIFREASISDSGATFLMEPKIGDPLIPGSIDDKYSMGMAFQIGYSGGRLAAVPYSLRHACLNIALTKPDIIRSRLVERIKAGKPMGYYNRLVDRYTAPLYQEFLFELTKRLSGVITGPMTDILYDRVFSALSKVVGKEISMNWFGVDEDSHVETISLIKLKKSRNEFSEPSDIKEINKYDLFNHITAAALGYTGDDRVALQEIGGLLL